MTDVFPKIRSLCDWIVAGGSELDTEFLGDLYQAHCEDARKGRALVQTPDFIRSFILERSLGESLKLHGPVAGKTIDPTCGCGHFLVDAFRMLFTAWMDQPREVVIALLNTTGGFDPSERFEAIIAQIVLDQVVGVDLDPVCVAIARMRLICEAWRASDHRMPYRVNVFEGDALLHHRPLPGDEEKYGPWPYDVAAVRNALRPGQYHAVVGNPPYIVCKDRKLNQAYRDRYPTCHRKYSLAVPFMEVFFGLAIPEPTGEKPMIREKQGTLFAERGAYA